MTGNHTPVSAGLTRPHSCVPICPARASARDFYLEPGTKRGDRDICSDFSDSQLLGLVLSESNETGSVRGYVVGFCRKISVGPGKEQVVVNQVIESVRIRVELRGSEARFHRHDLGIWRADQDRFHDADCRINHKYSLVAGPNRLEIALVHLGCLAAKTSMRNKLSA